MSDGRSAEAAAERRKVAPYYAGGGSLRAKHELVKAQRAPDFVGWVLDQLSVPRDAHVLDAGAGWGRFTWPLIERFQLKPSRVVASDVFTEAVRETRAAGEERGHHVKFVVADIAALPFRDATFDWTLANHVLYHVPALGTGVRELRRVLRRGGTLVATTNADDIPVAIYDYHREALGRLGVPAKRPQPSPFSLRNGEAILRAAFGDVTLRVFSADFAYPTVDEFMAAYERTGTFRLAVEHERVPAEALLAAVREVAIERRTESGCLPSPIKMGVFLCVADGT